MQFFALHAPNTGQQNKVITAAKWAEQKYCGSSPGDRIFKSVRNGALVGFGIGAVKGFVVGEIFGGEVTFGATGIPGAIAGGVIQGAVGGMNGLIKGVASAGACDALGVYK